MVRKSSTRWRRLRRRLTRTLITGLLLAVLGSVLVVAALRFVAPPTSAFMMQRWMSAQVHGEQDFRLRYRWTAWDDVAATLPLAMIAAEDQKFPQHRGFDVAAIRSVLASAQEGERLRGASTISQQVAKNLFLWPGRSFVRKGLEAWFTLLIEALWSKQRILEVYMNIAEFGDGIYGVAAASEAFFGRTPAQLDARQSALLAAVLPSPRRYSAAQPSAWVQQRANWIMRQSRQLGGTDYLPR